MIPFETALKVLRGGYCWGVLPWRNYTLALLQLELRGAPGVDGDVRDLADLEHQRLGPLHPVGFDGDVELRAQAQQIAWGAELRLGALLEEDGCHFHRLLAGDAADGELPLR